jgi:hypothetical protein
MGFALSPGERVDHDGAFASRRGPGEGSIPLRGPVRELRLKLLHGIEYSKPHETTSTAFQDTLAFTQ